VNQLANRGGGKDGEDESEESQHIESTFGMPSLSVVRRDDRTPEPEIARMIGRSNKIFGSGYKVIIDLIIHLSNFISREHLIDKK